jgi:uroporphyrin-III C-methyltransferase/precorrin-2 dehydrogenase/sirohydrochlorin ferrochelatase
VDIPYLAGLDLRGRPVVMIGGGGVAQRKLPTLLDAGARVTLVSPEVTPAVEGMADAGELTWLRREYATGDLADAWYVLALTDRPEVNGAVVQEATGRRVFCVRADQGTAGTASTPATGLWHGLRIAVSSGRLSGGATGRDPLRAAAVRDGVLEWLRTAAGEALLTRSGRRPVRQPGGPGAPRLLPGVALVGGGPGEEDLITVRGRRMLAMADVVVADRLAPRSLLAELRPDVEVVDAAKLPRGRFMAQDAINACLVQHALAGRFVVRLKGGDPYVFGRGSEEVEACLDAGVPVTVVPGLSSAIAVPALAGIPLTHRGVAHEAVIVSGHLEPGHPQSLVDWDALGRLTGTLVVLMGVANLPLIAAVLVTAGRPPRTPVAVIQDGSMPTQRVHTGTLATIAEVAAAVGVRALLEDALG